MNPAIDFRQNKIQPNVNGSIETGVYKKRIVIKNSKSL